MCAMPGVFQHHGTGCRDRIGGGQRKRVCRFKTDRMVVDLGFVRSANAAR
jgi:hypothetical protein